MGVFFLVLPFFKREKKKRVAFCCRFSARIKISRPPASASAAAVVDLFGFSAGAWRLPNSALRASPKILLFALSELKNCRRPKRPKRHRRRTLENSARRFRPRRSHSQTRWCCSFSLRSRFACDCMVANIETLALSIRDPTPSARSRPSQI